jgi:glycine cleavage system aminomethyltransferase T
MGFMVEQVSSCRFPPAGFAAIDILRIEAGYFLFINEWRMSPSVAELGLSALLEDTEGSPEISLWRRASRYRP